MSAVSNKLSTSNSHKDLEMINQTNLINLSTNVISSNTSLIATNEIVKEDDDNINCEEYEENTCERNDNTMETDNDDDEQNSLTDDEMVQFKQIIYDHPLFPLLKLMFEKCEHVMHIDISSDVMPSIYFDRLIEKFIEENKLKKFTLQFTKDSVDEMIFKAMQVLCIHATEVQKVNELCIDFCLRYISRLKQTLSPSQILQIDPNDEDDFELENDNDDDCVETSSLPAPNTNQVISGGTVYQMVQTPQGLVAQPVVIQQPPAIEIKPIDGEDSKNQRTKQRRGVLPKKATQIMKTWLFQHINHPYPSEDEKKLMATQTNLSLLQVNNWFINGRRRILHPMMNDLSSKLATSGDDDSIDESVINLSKKTKVKKGGQSTNRFWPLTLAEKKVKERNESGIEELTNSDVEVPNKKSNFKSFGSPPQADASLILKQHELILQQQLQLQLQQQIQQQLLSTVQLHNQNSNGSIVTDGSSQQIQPSYFIFNPIDIQSILQQPNTSGIQLLSNFNSNALQPQTVYSQQFNFSTPISNDSTFIHLASTVQSDTT